MIQPVKQGLDLIREIDEAVCPSPNLWWLGHCGFVVKYGSIVFYIDPYLSDSQEERYSKSTRPHPRLTSVPVNPLYVHNADLVLCTHAHHAHMDPGTLPRIFHSSDQARLVIPKSAAGRAYSLGIDYPLMRTTDADLRLEYVKEGDEARIYAIPSAHEQLDWTPSGGYPYLGYIIRFGDITIYHSGDCVPYEGLVERLKPYNLTLAMLPINGRDPDRGMPGNFTIQEVGTLASQIGVRWVVPMHYGMFAVNNADPDRFAEHMLQQHPEIAFKIFQPGERWAIPMD